MYAGFITHRHAFKHFGVHQRLDYAAYQMVRHYFAPGSFPPIKQVIHFEGPNGPDGLKVKSPGKADPAHFYDPIKDSGEVPQLITDHYDKLVDALRDHDQVRSAFEASWLAHYVVDGLTPAHHQLIDEQITRIQGGKVPVKGKFKYLARGEGSVKKNWAVWGGNGIWATHHNFEIGVAMALVGHTIKGSLDEVKLAQARKMGALDFFKEEAKAIARLDVYNKFKVKGWTAQIGVAVKDQIIPRTAQAVAIIWLLAYLEAGLKDARTVAAATIA